MEKSRKIKIAADVIMLFCGLILLIILRYGLWDKEKSIMVEIGLFLCMVVILADLSIQFLIKAKISLSRTLEETGNIKTGMGIERLILLDEQNKTGKIHGI